MREPVERELAEAKERRDGLRRALGAGEGGARARQGDHAAHRRADAWRPSARSAAATCNASPRSATASCRRSSSELAERDGASRGSTMVKEEVDEDDVAAVVATLDGHPGRPAARGRDRRS